MVHRGKGTDKWDQVMTFIAQGYFKPSKLKVYFEIGFNDHLHNLYELRAHWDISAAYLYGIRKKGLFGHKNIIFGVEYLDLIQRTFSDHGALQQRGLTNRCTIVILTWVVDGQHTWGRFR